ncbi:MAG: galactokinase family protein [Caldilineaceae bacterium]
MSCLLNILAARQLPLGRGGSTIGEHTDYNDGFVLPVALKRDVRIVFRPVQTAMCGSIRWNTMAGLRLTWTTGL